MKKVRITSFIGLFLLLSKMTYSQDNNVFLKTKLIRKNTIDLSIGGNGLFASVNYNRIIMTKSNYFISSLIGIGATPFVGVGGITLPHQITLNFGKTNSFVELGIGGSYWLGKSNASGYTETINSYQLSPIIGWRKHLVNNLVFRVYTNPLIHISGEKYIEDYSIIPYLGISFGYRF